MWHATLPKTYKTWMALEMAVAVASGSACLSTLGVPSPGPVLLYAAEDSQSTLRLRLESLTHHHALQLRHLDIRVIIADSLRLDRIPDQERLEATLLLHRLALLILDPLVRLHAIDENAAGEIAALLGYPRLLQRKTGAAIALVHHARKNVAANGGAGYSLRGSSDLYANGTPGPAGTTKPADEKFLEDLVASRPDLLGIGGWDDETDIEGPFHAFRQLSLHALNGRSIAPDLVLLSRSGHIVVVEVKLSDNPELRDRQVVAQLLEYAASFAQYTEDECLALFGGKACGVATWAAFVQTLFPEASERLAHRFLDKLRTGKLHLIIACDEAPRGLRELVRGVVGQHALGEYEFRVVEIAPYVTGTLSTEVIFLPPRLSTD